MLAGPAATDRMRARPTLSPRWHDESARAEFTRIEASRNGANLVPTTMLFYWRNAVEIAVVARVFNLSE
jgi:hypothetical protein